MQYTRLFQLLFPSSFYFTIVSTSGLRYHDFARRVKMHNKLYVFGLLEEMWSTTKLHCLFRCNDNVNCSHVFHNFDSKQCRLYDQDKKHNMADDKSGWQCWNKIDCGRAPEITNMSVVRGKTTYKSEAIYRCRPGYKSEGGLGRSLCGHDSTWSRITLTCTGIDCGKPVFKNADVVKFGPTTYKSTAQIQCGLGLYSPNDQPSVCTKSGKWSNLCEEIPHLITKKALPERRSPGPRLKCRTVISSKENGKAMCNKDEIMTGCSSTIKNLAIPPQLKYGSSGSRILKDDTCEGRGSRAVARCCKIPGLQCEYTVIVGERMSCYKNYQLLDCSCYRCSGVSGPCPTVIRNNKCEGYTTVRAIRCATCCSGSHLSCTVKEVHTSSSYGGQKLLIGRCGAGEVMVACSAFDKDMGIKGAVVETIDEEDQCHIDGWHSSMSTLKGYMTCCK